MNKILHNSLHIETTTRCTLACPACPRTVWHNITKHPVPKSDLNIESLEKFLDCESGKSIKTFLLCGDYGDPIYYPDLFKLIAKFRDRVNFQIVTNGSRQSVAFWEKLSDHLTKDDIVIFSIDGLESTNHLYRINSDWASIMQGLDIMSRSSARLHWKTIVFKFNYDKLEEIKTFAESKGATFHAEKTHRFGKQELAPPLSEFIENNHLFQQEFTTNHEIEIEPRCERDASIITADGYFFPCCWIRAPQTLYKSQLWKQKSRWLDKLKIENTSYDDALMVVRDWEKYVRQNSLNGSANVDVLCKMLCRKGCQANKTVSQSNKYEKQNNPN